MTQENDRQGLRSRILAQRDMLTEDDRREKSEKIVENIWQLVEVADAGSLFFIYVNFRSEVETEKLIRQCLARGKVVAVPYTDVRAKALLPFQIVDLENDLRPGYCDIPEPDPGRSAKVDAEKVDIVVIPGSVFDIHGGRLGYGGGYYDRFLVNDAPQARRIGLAFEMQVVERVPVQPHDQPLDILITEKRIVNINRKKEEPSNA